jgi:hypothetical protein
VTSARDRSPGRTNVIRATPLSVSSGSLLQRKCACGQHAGGGECDQCKKKHAGLQRSAQDQAAAATAPPIVGEVLRSSGKPLDGDTLSFFEPRFEHDFSGVRVHADARAAESAQAVGALAYTVGPNIVFNREQYRPGSPEGTRLLAHELTHVVQQRNTGQELHRLQIGDTGDPSETEAQRAESLIMNHQGVNPSEVSGTRVARETPKQKPTPEPEPTPPTKTCGPDATDWFVAQAAAAKKDPLVLAIKSNLDGAHRVAARYGFSAERVAEGGIAKKVQAEEAKAGSPARTPEATSQMAASVPGQKEFGRAVVAATAPIPFAGAPEQIVLLSIRRAANAWKSVVGTKAKYDFKYDTSTMMGPKSAHCPQDCANTITLCPSTGSDCFQTDVPGNLFYAHIGKFVGWSELSLQLGSEFAQLESTKTWDPPEDTRMISIGSHYPIRLRAALFVQPSRRAVPVLF